MMDFRCYDPVLDPVIVVCHNRVVRYANAAATKWLNILNADGIINQPLSHYVEFSGSDALTNIESLAFYKYTKYEQTQFALKLTPFSGAAKVSVQRYPSDLYTLLFAIFIRERAFAQVMSDEESIELINRNIHMTAAQLMPEVSDTSGGGVSELDENTVARAVSADSMAKFDSQANLFFIDAKKACRGVVEVISENWVDVIIKNFPGLAADIQCNIEVSGNVKLRGFSTVGTVVSFRQVGSEDASVRIKFGPLSPLAKKAIDEYLETNAIKF